MIKKVEFNSLQGYIHVPKKYKHAIIVLHGFPSRCEGFTISRLANALGKNFLTLRFDHSGTGMSTGKFEDKLISTEVKEVRKAVDFLSKNFDYENLILVGHSTGAINAALYAHKDKRVDKISLIGGSGNLKEAVQYEFTPLQVKSFWEKGWMRYKREGKWYHNKKLKKAYYEEFFTLDIEKSLHKYKGDVLIIHPEKDEFIPLKDAKQLLHAATKPKKLVILRDADHRFTKPAHFRKLITVVNKFCK